MATDPFKDRGDEAVAALQGILEGRADSYEIFFSKDAGLSVEAREGAVDALKVRSNRGAGLRVISGGRPGFGFTSVLDRDALTEMAAMALSGSKGAAEDKFLGFPERGAGLEAECPLDVMDPSYGAAGEKEKIAGALKIEEAALSYDKRVRRVRKATYSESMKYTRVVNSNGVDAA
ncbi:MAG: hypothetical protein HZB83_04820, partial [Deltaproteobacteria bacterium]|nr:hypothetical protein [Deltaproteobacteria bacterium]